MFRNRVHGNREGQQMARHDEDDKQQLADTEDLATNRPKEDLTGISQILDMWIAPSELADDVTGVGGQKTEANDENNSATLG